MITAQFAESTAQFEEWTPALGESLNPRFAMDSETTPIDKERPWFRPPIVLATAYDGVSGFFIAREQLGAFFRAHRKHEWIMHHAAFDLAVLQQHLPTYDVYQLVDRNAVWDTELLHRLHMIGATGNHGLGQSSLDHCAMVHLGVDLPKSVCLGSP